MRRLLDNTPFLAPTLALVSGIALASKIPTYLFGPLIAAGVCFIAGGLLALTRERLRLAFACGLSGVLVASFALSLAAKDRWPSDDLRLLLANGSLSTQPSSFDGCVAEDARSFNEEIRIPTQIRGVLLNGRWIRTRGLVPLRIPQPTTDAGRDSMPVPHMGDRIRGWAEWSFPRNFLNPGSADRVSFLARRGIHINGRVRSLRVLEILPGDCHTTWSRAIAGARGYVRHYLIDPVRDSHPREAAILSSLVLGDYSGLDAPTREVFQNTGTYHVLVISGLHVGWIAWVMMAALRITGIPDRWAGIMVAVAIFVYASIIGFQASVARSVMMFLLYLLARSLYRTTRPKNLALACGFWILILVPDWLFDLGFQLSFLSVLAIFFLAVDWIESLWIPLIRPLQGAGVESRRECARGWAHAAGRRGRFLAELISESVADRVHPILGKSLLLALRGLAVTLTYIGSMMLVSISVQILLGPLLAYHFNRTSWVAPIANLIIVPLSSVVLALGAAATMLGAVSFLGSSLSYLAVASASLLMNSTRWFSGLPGAWQRSATPDASCVGIGIVLIFLWSVFEWKRRWIPCLLVTALLLILTSGLAPRVLLSGLGSLEPPNSWKLSTGFLRITSLDVGQGDSLVIKFPDDRLWVLDAGGIRESVPEEASFDIGEVVVSRYLWACGTRRLDRALLSHPHQDHAGGLGAVLRNFQVSELEHGGPSGDPTLERVLESAASQGTTTRNIYAGMSWNSAGVQVEVLNPPQEGASRSINDNSVVLRLRFGRFSALLMGDLEKPGEQELLLRTPELETQFLKVTHHGSRTATLDPFLDRVRPRWAIISAGRSNPFGHPARETLLRLIRHKARPLITMDQGAIALETDGTRYILSTHVSGILEQGTLH